MELPRFLYPVLVYRSILSPFLTVCSIALPTWAIARFVYLRRSGQRPMLYREVVLLSFVIYLSGLAAATLTPNRGELARDENAAIVDLRPSLASLVCSSPSLPEGSTPHSFCVRNARGNVLLFIPLGILAPLIWQGLTLGRGVLIALAFSVGIELLQFSSRLFGSYRLADVNDVILNVTGAGIGLGTVMLVQLLRAGKRAFQTPAQ